MRHAAFVCGGVRNMIPFGNHAVTLLRREGGAYKRYVLTGCSWRDSAARMLNGEAIAITMETTCRIPAGQKVPQPGDLLVLGTVKAAANSEIELVRLMQKLREDGYAVFRVSRVKDNSRGAPMPHFAVTGE